MNDTSDGNKECILRSEMLLKNLEFQSKLSDAGLTEERSLLSKLQEEIKRDKK